METLQGVDTGMKSFSKKPSQLMIFPTATFCSSSGMCTQLGNVTGWSGCEIAPR